ncbi:MAG TPA: nucleotide exchange factor GrpE [Thermoplasmata archaeon]|nr:nucleotide exchange factor GrpE [Thermoplasmata archaeon]
MPEEMEDALPSEEDTQPTGGDAKGTVSVEDALTAKDRQIQDLTDTLKRTQAEFENYKKRVNREWSEKSKLAGERIVGDILAVLDTFDKALEKTDGADDATAQSNGLEGIHKQLLQILQRTGLKEIDTRAPFDPFMHEALMREERDDGDDGTILEVFQRGYIMGPKVIRTAKVKVSAKKRRDEGDAVESESVSNQHDDQH